MNTLQKRIFLQAIENNRIDHSPVKDDGEMTILCPKCGPGHDNRRRTLGLNTNNDKWNCFRCSPKFKGITLSPLIRALGLNSILPSFEKGGEEIVVEDDSLKKMRNRLMFGEEPVVKTKEHTQLPEEYRTDWEKTITGRKLLGHLLRDRKLSREVINKYRLGYSVGEKYFGSIIIPVYAKKKLVFWQVRRTILFTGSKYDSPTVERRGFLYGSDEIERDVTIVEGAFDKLAMLKLDVSVCALLSKAISPEQIGLLAKKNVKNVTVILDGAAWRECKATARYIAENLWTVRKVRALRLPYKADPGALGVRTFDEIREEFLIR